jgi:hypothetical protein
MGLFRPSRTARAGRWFEWKIRVFLAGATLAMVGIFLDDRRVIAAALAVLAVGVVLRALPDGGAPTSADDDEDADEEDRAEEEAEGDDDGRGWGTRDTGL